MKDWRDSGRLKTVRVLACLFLLSPPALASTVAEVRLAFYTGVEFFEPGPEECTVRLLEDGKAVDVEFDHAKQRLEVPYGRYALVVESPGFRSYRRDILVSQPKVDLLVGLQLAEIANYSQPPPPTVIEGRVVGKQVDYATLWVRAMPVFGGRGVALDSRLDGSGRFSITTSNPIGTESGKYMILVLAPKPIGESWTELSVISVKEVYLRHHRTTDVEIVIE